MKITVEKRHTNDYNKARVYIFPKGETIIENFFNRRSRPYNLYKKDVMPTVLNELDLPTDTRMNWSQKAGCSCGCSPGFILPDYRGFNVFVDVEK